MPKNQTLDEFYRSFRDEVLCACDTETSGWTTEDFLTNVMLEYLEEAGEVTDPVICPFRGHGLQLNAYAISEDCESVDIFVSIYSDTEQPRSVSQTDVDAAIKRAIQLYHKATNDLYTSFQKDNDTYEFAITLHKNKDCIKRVRICALTNGLVKPIALKNITIGCAEVSFSLWDIDRLYRCVTSGKMRETIEIDFEEKFQTTIPCIENSTSDKYSVYLAIINGNLLADLYDEFRDRLLEKNVRSFLQVKGNVNKGIRDTLREEPDMFLAYNNGISVTAESVEIVRDDNGKPSIKRIRDMQIVNGGQTTASIFNARNDRKIAADLSQVFVQMKISVIVFFWKRFYTAGLGHAKAHFGGQGGAAVMKTVVWNVNGFAPASAKAFAHPRQVQSRHFLLSGNQDPVSAFRSRASLVLEPGQTPGGRGRT